MASTDPEQTDCTCPYPLSKRDKHDDGCPVPTQMVTIPLQELENLKHKNRAQAHWIRVLSEASRRKSVDLDALSFVWCSGACPGGVHRYHPDLILTEEMVERAERNTKRLRQWYNGVKWRLDKFPTMSKWHASYAEAAASRTDLAGGSNGGD